VTFAFPTITSKNGITVDDLRLGGDGYFESSVGMGANLVIALLSGPDGRIHLDVPVSLELDEEETRLELEQLEGAVQGAMQRSLDGVGAVQGGSPRFEALRSAPGQPSLEAGQEGRIGSLAALLGEKPAVAVVLRGVAADADAAALAAQRGVSPESLPRDQLDALAAQRAEAVRRALAGRGVAANQIEIGGASQGATSGVSWTLALASD
jgi:hypothetical protein